MPKRWHNLIPFAALLAGAAKADEAPLGESFRAEVARIAAKPLGGLESAAAWKGRRPELQRQLLDMLGLWPLPERTDLKAEVRGTVERPDFVVEKLVYQARSGLYVTANLYRPKQVEGRLPAILYVCGHSKVEKDGVIYGCKAHYGHHAAWYAANGYVCLVLDTLQLGELPGLHHGTSREGMWWWQSRGYTPAGVEAWNAVRGIDYLISRPEVDPKRIGVTGRSGGGATSWWVGAIDDRVAAVCPVAGITDLSDHVVSAPKPYPDGVIEGHCDCMFFVNTHRWDFDILAALVAPKPLLVENTDADPIFPEAGVRRIYARLETVYGWHDARDRLGLVIGKGGHIDSPELRHASFAFFDKWLKGKETDPSKIDEPDRKVPVEELRALNVGEAPPDCRNANAHEWFVAPAAEPAVPESKEAWEALRSRLLAGVRTQVFGGWPGEGEAGPLDAKVVRDERVDGFRFRVLEFASQPGVRLRLLVRSLDRAPSGGADADDPARAVTCTIDEGSLQGADAESIADAIAGRPIRLGGPEGKGLRAALGPGAVMVSILPRGVGPTAWDPKRATHVRRRFALLGQTLEGMQIWDVRRALAAVRTLPDLEGRRFVLAGHRQGAGLAVWAALFEPEDVAVFATVPPRTVREGPALLNLERLLGMPQAVALLHPRQVELVATPRMAWAWPQALADRLGGGRTWPRITFGAKE